MNSILDDFELDSVTTILLYNKLCFSIYLWIYAYFDLFDKIRMVFAYFNLFTKNVTALLISMN